jgi:hypothetical protein
MVTVAILVVALLPGRSLVAGSGYHKDSTTAWCSKIDSKYVYRCYPNPWGSSNVNLYVRFLDTLRIKGCFHQPFVFRHVFQKGEWFLIGQPGPYLPRLSLDLDKACLDWGKIQNALNPGDSVEMEFWFTPRDTIVTDTVRGTFKAWYRGNLILPERVQLREPTQPIRWTRSGLYSSLPLVGPFRLTDLRGRSHPIQIRSSGTGTLVAPSRRLPTGVYRLIWPRGQAVVLVPGD